MNKTLTFLLSLTFLFLFSGSSVVFADDYEEGLEAFERQDYKEAVRLFTPLAEQGLANAQFGLGFMYAKGQVLSGMVENYRKAIETTELEERICKLEEKAKRR